MRRYHRSDLKMINAWRRHRGLLALTHRQIPSIGVIEPEVAAVFCHRVECDLGLVESLITHPHASAETRHLAFVEGWRMLEAEARAAGIRRLLALTANFESTKRAVETAGFEILSGTLVACRDL
jgi:N-acetylglutamate synthase-like GNAT family acetyltransferase